MPSVPRFQQVRYATHPTHATHSSEKKAPANATIATVESSVIASTGLIPDAAHGSHVDDCVRKYASGSTHLWQ